jgi:hypothetical protein
MIISHVYWAATIVTEEKPLRERMPSGIGGVMIISHVYWAATIVTEEKPLRERMPSGIGGVRIISHVYWAAIQHSCWVGKWSVVN